MRHHFFNAALSLFLSLMAIWTPLVLLGTVVPLLVAPIMRIPSLELLLGCGIASVFVANETHSRLLPFFRAKIDCLLPKGASTPTKGSALPFASFITNVGQMFRHSPAGKWLIAAIFCGFACSWVAAILMAPISPFLFLLVPAMSVLHIGFHIGDYKKAWRRL